jgi:DNA-binding NarL/FixJ family response regulator
MSRIRVLIADDQPLIRCGLRALLATTDDMEVVGEAACGAEAASQAADLQPDVIVMDLRMPGPNGIEATRRILQASPQTRILVLTPFADDDSVFAALRAGARGYVLKEANEDDVLRAIRTVSDGDAVFSAPVAQRLIEYFAAPRPSARFTPFPDLTDREREILALVAQGQDNAQIARSLVLSLKTVRNYISSIFTKLKVADRTQAILRARAAGFR